MAITLNTGVMKYRADQSDSWHPLIIASSNDIILYFDNVSCSQITDNVFAVCSDNSITSDYVVLECTFDNPEYIKSDIEWETSAGTLELSGTCSASTIAHIVLGKNSN